MLFHIYYKYNSGLVYCQPLPPIFGKDTVGAEGSFGIKDDAEGNSLVNEDAFGNLDANPVTPATTAPSAPILGNLDVKEEILGIPFGVLTNPPIPPTVLDAKFGFFTPAIIPSIPFGFVISGIGNFGKSGFWISTFGSVGKFGKLGFGMFGADTFGMSTFGILGTDGILVDGIDGADSFGKEKSDIY